MWEQHVRKIEAQEALRESLIARLGWLEEEDQREVLNAWQMQAGYEVPVWGSNVQSISEEDFRAEIGVPQRPERRNG